MSFIESQKINCISQNLTSKLLKYPLTFEDRGNKLWDTLTMKFLRRQKKIKIGKILKEVERLDVINLHIPGSQNPKNGLNFPNELP